MDFLKEAFDVNDKAITDLLSMILCEDSGLGGKAIDVETAYYAKLLGISKKSYFSFMNNEKYIYHFPDGNATLVRLLVKKLIPEVASFKSVEESVLSKFDYSKLDKDTNQINIRLNSFVSSMENINNKTQVQYLQNNTCIQIEAKHTIMAGWHSVASYIVKDVSKKQKELLRANIKMPLIYVQVALNNWEFLKKAGVATTYCPSSYFQFVNIDFPINMGAYKAIKTPNKPAMLTMIRVPTPTNKDEEIPHLLKLGRYDALGTSLEKFTKEIKSQLQEMFIPYDFNYERDVYDVVINRWGHGYTYEDALNKEELKMVRKSVGNIFFANADSAGQAYSDAAIDMANNAVKQIKKQLN